MIRHYYIKEQKACQGRRMRVWKAGKEDDSLESVESVESVEKSDSKNRFILLTESTHLWYTFEREEKEITVEKSRSLLGERRFVWRTNSVRWNGL